MVRVTEEPLYATRRKPKTIQQQVEPVSPEVQEWREELTEQYPSEHYRVEWTPGGAVVYPKPTAKERFIEQRLRQQELKGLGIEAGMTYVMVPQAEAKPKPLTPKQFMEATLPKEVKATRTYPGYRYLEIRKAAKWLGEAYAKTPRGRLEQIAVTKKPTVTVTEPGRGLMLVSGFAKGFEAFGKPEIPTALGSLVTGKLGSYAKSIEGYEPELLGELYFEYLTGKYVFGPAISKIGAGVKGGLGWMGRRIPSHFRYVASTKWEQLTQKLTTPIHRKVVWPVKYEVGHLWRGSTLQRYLKPVSFKIVGIEKAFAWTKEAPRWYIGLSGVPKKLIPRLAAQYSLEAHQTLYYPVALKAYTRERYFLSLLQRPSYGLRSLMRTSGIKHFYASWIQRGKPVYRLEKKVESFAKKTRFDGGKRTTPFKVTFEKVAPPKVTVTTTGQQLAQTATQIQKQLPTLTIQKQLPTLTLVKEYAQPKTIMKQMAKAPQFTMLHKWIGPAYPFRTMSKKWGELGLKLATYPLARYPFKPYPKAKKRVVQVVKFPVVTLPKSVEKVEKKRKVEPAIAEALTRIVVPTPIQKIEQEMNQAQQQNQKQIQEQVQKQTQRQQYQFKQIQRFQPFKPPSTPPPPRTPLIPPPFKFKFPKEKQRKRRLRRWRGEWFLRVHPIPTPKQVLEQFGGRMNRIGKLAR